MEKPSDSRFVPAGKQARKLAHARFKSIKGLEPLKWRI